MFIVTCIILLDKLILIVTIVILVKYIWSMHKNSQRWSYKTINNAKINKKCEKNKNKIFILKISENINGILLSLEQKKKTKCILYLISFISFH